STGRRSGLFQNDSTQPASIAGTRLGKRCEPLLSENGSAGLAAPVLARRRAQLNSTEAIAYRNRSYRFLSRSLLNDAAGLMSAFGTSRTSGIACTLAASYRAVENTVNLLSFS